MPYLSQQLFARALPTPTPPRGLQRTLQGRSILREDPFYELRNLDNPVTAAYLEQERDFMDRLTGTLLTSRDELVREFRTRIPEPDESYPMRRGAFEYFTRIEPDRDYPIHLRRRVGDTHIETVLDENVVAEGHDFLGISGIAIADDDHTIAYGVDFTGEERYTLRIGQLTDGVINVLEEIPSTSYGFVFTNDATQLLYTRPDEAMRPDTVLLHALGSDSANDRLLMHEDDQRFYLDVGRTKDRELLVISSASAITSEYWLLPTSGDLGTPTCFRPREQGLEYHLDHINGTFYLLAAHEGEEYRLFSAQTPQTPWQPFFDLPVDDRLESFEATSLGLVLQLRSQDRTKLTYVAFDRAPASTGIELSGDDAAITSILLGNADPAATTIRIEETSLGLPATLYEIDLATLERTTLWQQRVVGDVNLANYLTYRGYAPSDDGTPIPVTVIHRRDVMLPVPTLLYSYGAYGEPIDPSFSTMRLSLLDRGFAYAIAHVRGGGELGRTWHDEGRLERKTQGFHDLLAASDWLISRGVTDQNMLCLRGASAGGLMVGATLNLDPHRFRAAVLEVPFVDCLTTISDPNLPLTITEWEEWGNPTESLAIEALMASYSPYDNLRAEPYPDLLVTTGLNDSRVSYWEPTKYVAKLRQLSPMTNVALKVEEEAGHMGASKRTEVYENEALVQAFLIAACTNVELP
ncbi:prolyl oligopeptidase family serine peptidase [Ferrimicrobium sp.]|uniref:S9 family peptidase n=1 Tax=Ferrimicrobium sp. TaxID=2926050 RepID=UPI00262C6FFF|nr:prolyl oligopeptidase family serine peptidase [Ferrimicrobium sp.]